MSDKFKTFSAAMRYGATLLPQCRGKYWARVGGIAVGPAVASCAVGAAYHAITGGTDVLKGRDPRQTAAQFGINDIIFDTIVSLNDQGDTREQIADWLEKAGL